MQRKVLVAAVAAALAAPGLALAQKSSVAISGYVHMSVDNIKYSQPAATRTTTSESRLNDESSSAAIFQVREDLGGGNAALARLDVKMNADSAAIAASGESYVGMSLYNAGRLTAGRHSMHFFRTPDEGWFKGVTLRAHPSSLVDFAGGGHVSVANATRTPNSLRWSSPNWGGFAIDVGYSFNPTTAPSNTEADLTAGNTARKGRAWNLNPTFAGKNWSIAYSYWNSKVDAPGTVAAPVTSAISQMAYADQRSDSIYGYYTWGGFKIGGMWNKTKLTASATGAGLAAVGAEVGNRTAWSIPIRYMWGNHNIIANYTRARDDRATAMTDGAKLWAVSYVYAFSKRTFVALTYSKITNDVGAVYSGYGDRGISIGASGVTSSLGSANSGAAPGEDPRYLAISMRHTY